LTETGKRVEPTRKTEKVAELAPGSEAVLSATARETKGVSSSLRVTRALDGEPRR